MNIEKFICNSFDKSMAFCHNPDSTYAEFDKLHTKIRLKMIQSVLHQKMTFDEFANIDNLFLRMKFRRWRNGN